MQLAGEYAYAGRDTVVAKVLEILGAEATEEVHNHHNFAWRERHGGIDVWVIRKGCTPAFPGQAGFVGATMGEPSVILEGVGSRARAGLDAAGVDRRGGGPDEAPGAYKRLDAVLGYHADSVRVLHRLRPLGVA